MFEGIVLNGHPVQRLAGNASITFPDVNSEAIMLQLKNIVAVSSGSACTSADPEPSHVLRAMGIDEALVKLTIRFGLGRFSTGDEVNVVAEAVADTVVSLRRLL